MYLSACALYSRPKFMSGLFSKCRTYVSDIFTFGVEATGWKRMMGIHYRFGVVSGRCKSAHIHLLPLNVPCFLSNWNCEIFLRGKRVLWMVRGNGISITINTWKIRLHTNKISHNMLFNIICTLWLYLQGFYANVLLLCHKIPPEMCLNAINYLKHQNK